MSATLNGTPRFQIVTRAIQSFVNNSNSVSGTSRVWRAMRTAGGGNNCDQTQLVSHGTNITNSDFLLPLIDIEIGGFNAYEAGLRSVNEDMKSSEAFNSDIRVAFIFLGSLDVSPCRGFYLLDWLRSIENISFTLCTFTMLENSAEFDAFRQQSLMQGFGCVHNVDDPESINTIMSEVVRRLIQDEMSTEEVINTPQTPTQIVYRASPILMSTSTPLPQTATDEATATSTYTVTPSPTATATVTVTATSTPSTRLTSIPEAEILVLTVMAEVSQTPQALRSPIPEISMLPTITNTPTTTATSVIVDASSTPTVTLQFTQTPTVEPSPPPGINLVPEGAPPIASRYVVVTERARGGIWVRSQPTTTAENIVLLLPGDTVEMLNLDRTGYWIWVRTEDNQFGWISALHLNYGNIVLKQ